MRSRPRRSLLSALLAVGLLGVAAGPAQAEDFIDHNGDDITFTDDAGENSTLTITATRAQIVVAQEGGDTIDAPAGCTGDGTSTVTCTPDGTEFDTFESTFFMNDGNDTVTANGELGVAIVGESGNDVIVGSDTNGSTELLSGNAGDDQINSRNVGPALPFEPDVARADGGFDPSIVGDSVFGGDGSDQLATGNGYDSASGDGEFSVIFGLQKDSEGDGFGGGSEGEAPGTDVISTGSGNDEGYGGSGSGDQLNLGEGEDFTFTFGGDGTGDVYAGGPGIDFIGFESTSEFEQNLNGAGSGLPFDDFGVNLATGAVTKTNTASASTNESDTAVEFEDTVTDSGNDNVIGTDSSNVITTGPGSDNVNPGNGTDTLFLDPDTGGGGISRASRGADGIDGPQAQPGNDVADVADGFNDRVFCGGGTDNVTADQFDETASDCEVVTRVEKRAGNADVIAPDCTLASVRRRYSRRAFLRGFNVRITCSEGANLTVQLLAKWTRKLFPSRAGDVVLAQKSATVTAGTAGTLKVRPAKKFRKRFRKKGFRVRVNVEAQDQYGNRSIERKVVRVKKVRKKRR